MKYTTLAAIAAVPAVAIMVSCSSQEERVANEMMDLLDEMTTVIEETTADNIAEQNAKMKEIVAKQKEIEKKITALTEEQRKAIEDDADMTAKGEAAQKRMMSAMEALMKKDMSLYAKLFEGTNM